MSQDFLSLDIEIKKFRMIHKVKATMTKKEMAVFQDMVTKYVNKIHKAANTDLSEQDLNYLSSLMEEAESILADSLSKKEIKQKPKQEKKGDWSEFNFWYNNLNYGSKNKFRL